MEKENKSADYDDFSLVSGGLIYKLMTLSLKNRDINNGISRRAISFTLIAWLPLLLLAIFVFLSSGQAVIYAFFKDFTLQFQLLLIVPFLIFTEKTVNTTFVEYIKASDDIVVNEQQGKFDKLVKMIDKLTNLYLPEIIMLVIIYSLAIYGIKHHEIAEYKSYFVNSETGNVNLIGYYYLFVSFPIIQLLLFRWLWRWIIWAYSMLVISRLKLQINAVSIDRMAGLTYLNFVPFKFIFIFTSIAIMIASNFGYHILYNGATLKDYHYDILFFVILFSLTIYLPLLLFIPHLIKSRSEGVYRLGRTAAIHNQAYMNKWADGSFPKDEPLLGNPDHSSLSDLNGGYGPVIDMTILPINLKMFGMSCFILLVPFVPLVFTYYSLMDLLKIILEAVS